MCVPKIQQISEAQVGQPDIGQNLFGVDRKQGFEPISIRAEPFSQQLNPHTFASKLEEEDPEFAVPEFVCAGCSGRLCICEPSFGITRSKSVKSVESVVLSTIPEIGDARRALPICEAQTYELPVCGLKIRQGQLFRNLKGLWCDLHRAQGVQS